MNIYISFRISKTKTKFAFISLENSYMMHYFWQIAILLSMYLPNKFRLKDLKQINLIVERFLRYVEVVSRNEFTDPTCIIGLLWSARCLPLRQYILINHRSHSKSSSSILYFNLEKNLGGAWPPSPARTRETWLVVPLPGRKPVQIVIS